MFIAIVNFHTVNAAGHSVDKHEVWEKQTLKELKDDFWHVFCMNRSYVFHIFENGIIIDSQTMCVWNVNESGRKIGKAQKISMFDSMFEMM